MRYVCEDLLEVVNCKGGASAPVIYVIDSPEHPHDFAMLAPQVRATLVRVPVQRWSDALTPWPAPGLYREEPDFGGDAAATLAELVDEAIPTKERGSGLDPSSRAVCGYSLGGLFSLYAFVHGTIFDACGCLSGSVWYEGWVNHMRGLGLELSGKFAYLSVGTKEKRAARPILRTVQDNMEECARILQKAGCEVQYQTSPGNHLQFVAERTKAGLAAIDDFLLRPRA